MNAILEAVELEKSYGRRRVVDGVSLHVNPSEIVGLLGPNGAGKSTSFKMMCGLVKPDRGRVTLSGLVATDWPLFRRASEGGMGYLAQESSVFRKLTVDQNISSLLELLGVPYRQRRERTDQLLEEFEISHLRKSKAGRLSGGERRRLEIARCLVSDPKIIMLDEPFAGIDPVTVQNIQQIIARLRDRGIAILITDHAAREILQTVDRCYVISKGSVLFEGDPQSVMNHPEVRREYLGEFSGDGAYLAGPHFQIRQSDRSVPTSLPPTSLPTSRSAGASGRRNSAETSISRSASPSRPVRRRPDV